MYDVEDSKIKAWEGWAGFYFPIWWYTAPTIVNSFLESYDFGGKKIVLFATSGGSGFEHSLEDLKKSVSADTVMMEGKMMNGRLADLGLKKWVECVCAK